MPEIGTDHLSEPEREFLERLLEELPEGDTGAAALEGLTPPERWWLWTRVMAPDPVRYTQGQGVRLLALESGDLEASIYAGRLAAHARAMAAGETLVVTCPNGAEDTIATGAQHHGMVAIQQGPGAVMLRLDLH